MSKPQKEPGRKRRSLKGARRVVYRLPEIPTALTSGLGCWASDIYYEGGQRFRHSLGTTDHALAKTRLAAFLTDLESQARDKPVTIAEIYAAYLEDRASEGKSTTRMKDAWKRLQGSFGHLISPRLRLSATLLLGQTRV